MFSQVYNNSKYKVRKSFKQSVGMLMYLKKSSYLVDRNKGLYSMQFMNIFIKLKDFHLVTEILLRYILLELQILHTGLVQLFLISQQY